MNTLSLGDKLYFYNYHMNQRGRASYVNEQAKYGLGRMARAARVALTDMFRPFTDLGMYALIYITKGGDTLCSDCARTDYINGDGKAQGEVYWEGLPIFCDECNKEIESAYGDPEEDADEMKDLYLAR